MEQYIGKFYGPYKITNAGLAAVGTYLAQPRVDLSVEDGEKVKLITVPQWLLDECVTDEVSDFTKLRDARVNPVAIKILGLLTDAEVTKAEIEYLVNMKVLSSVGKSIDASVIKLLGKDIDEVTLKELDDILTKNG